MSAAMLVQKMQEVLIKNKYQINQVSRMIQQFKHHHPEQNDATSLKMLLLLSMDKTILFDLDEIISCVCQSSNVRTASKPTRRICYSSPDWKTLMHNLYIYFSKSKEEQKEMKNFLNSKG